MEDLYERFVKAIVEETAYDFISNEGHNFRKEDLIKIIKEYMFAVYQANSGLIDCEEIEQNVIDSLSEEFGI